jgi:hypothetical protein
VQFTIPPNVLAASAQSGSSVALQPGDVVNALVLALLADGKVRIAIANKTMDVVSQVPLEPGTTVQLAVKSTATGLVLSLVDQGSEQVPASTGTAVAGSAVARPAALAAAVPESPVPAPMPVSDDIAAPRAPDVRPAAAALSQAVGSAAARQNGLAPLFANISEVAQAQSLPAPVRAAMARLASFQTSTAAPVTADDVKRAFSRSGLFLETRMATSTAGAAAAAPPDLKAALVVFRQVLKGWLDTLPTAPDAATTGTASRSAGVAVQGTAPQPQPTADPKVPAQVHATVAASGEFRLAVAPSRAPEQAGWPAPGAAAPPAEAGPSGKNPPQASAPRPSIVTDIEGKVAAAVAGAAAGEAIEDTSPDARLPRGPAMIAEPETQDDAVRDAALPLRAALALARERILPPTLEHRLLVALSEPKVSLATPQQNLPAASMPTAESTPNAMDAAPDATAVPAPAKPPVPPYRGGPMAAQPPALASTSVDAEPRAVAERLLADTDAALARHTLLQAASLPDAGDARTDRADARWTFDIPFATPQGTAIAQFEIARDGRRGASADNGEPAWRARFSLDTEPLGPVHVHIALNQARAAVTLWAEREASAARLRQDAPLLAQALREADLEPGDVLVRSGEPPRPAAAAAGRFLDRAS